MDLALTLIRLNYVFLSFLLTTYSAWRYHQHKKKHMLYFATAFTFLTLAALLQTADSVSLSYVMQMDVPQRLLEASSLAFFVLFTIAAVIALRITIKTDSDTA